MTIIQKLEKQLEKCQQTIIEVTEQRPYDWTGIVQNKAEYYKALEELKIKFERLVLTDRGLKLRISETQAEIQLQNQSLNNAVHKMIFDSNSNALAENIHVMFQDLERAEIEREQIQEKIEIVTARANEIIKV